MKNENSTISNYLQDFFVDIFWKKPYNIGAMKEVVTMGDVDTYIPVYEVYCDEEDQLPSNRLFPPPSFLRGIGRIFNIGGTGTVLVNENNPQDADRLALKHDFEVIGQDLRKVMDNYEKTVHAKGE